MRGLLIKDIRLLTARKKSLLMMLAMCLMMSFSISGIMAGYMAMILGILATSTITLDEYANGLAFLFTLPIDAAVYVREKYRLCAVMSVLGCVAGMFLDILMSLIRGDSDSVYSIIIGAAGLIPAVLVMMSILIPIQLKFGAEKSRVVLMIFYGMIFAVAALLLKVDSVAAGIDSLVQAAGNLPGWVFPVGIIAAVAALGYCSYRISVKIMSNKEF